MLCRTSSSKLRVLGPVARCVQILLLCLPTDLSAQVAAAAVAIAPVIKEQLMYICSAGELSLQ
jgi:hypothetical protein